MPRQIARLLVLALPLVALGGCPDPQPLPITPADLPNAAEGRSYSVQLSAAGRAPETWSIDSGALPPGLHLGEQNGKISGTPTRPGDFTFTVSVSDSSSNVRTGSESYSLTVVPRLDVGDTLPAGRVDTAYNQRISVGGGTPPYTVSVIGLPAGLSFDPATRRITGAPLIEDANLEIQIDVRDAGPPRQHVTQIVALPIDPLPVSITTTALPAARRNIAYGTRVRASNGTPPYSFAITDGILPRGLRLDLDSGIISGTPTESGAFEIRVNVSDSDSPPSQDSARLTLTVTD